MIGITSPIVIFIIVISNISIVIDVVELVL